MLHILRATDRAGKVSFYTGRAGDGWVSANRSEAFTYEPEGARGKAESFNRWSQLHGLTFEAVEV